MTGAISATEGRVSVNGYDVSKHHSKVALQIGYVPAEGALYERMSVEEFLFFVASAKKIPFERAGARVKDVCAICELDACKGRLISTLSFSIKRRVLLAQAILGDPSVLIVGDPFDNLDATTRKIFGDVIAELKSRGASVVLVCDCAFGCDELCDATLTLGESNQDDDVDCDEDYDGNEPTEDEE
jgi:ABC-2 type transport system ATP-binding protein